MDFVHVELKRDSWFAPAMVITSPEDAVHFVKNMIRDRDRETLVSIQVATSGRVINASICSVGTASYSLVPIPEILRTAILSGANGIILIHNHPSGSVKASKEDTDITKRLVFACQMMGIELLDHIIIGEKDTFSFRKSDVDVFSIDHTLLK